MFCPSCGQEIPEGSSFCLHCGKPLGKKEKISSAEKFGPVVAVILIVLLLGGVLWYSEEPVSAPAEQVTEKLTSGQIVVPAGKYYEVQFRINPSMRSPRVKGSFRTSGGGGNDIQAVLAEESEFENWINGHQAQVLYATEKITNGKIDVVIPEPGTYHLAFNNSFSVISEKYVFAEIELSYQNPR